MLKIHHNHASSELNVIKCFLLITLYSSLMPTCLLKTKMVHGKHFVIHVPMKLRTHHHTHTVYKQMHGVGSKDNNVGNGAAGKASKQTIYKIMGYSTHQTGLTAGGSTGSVGAKNHHHQHHHHHHRHHGHSHGYRQNRGSKSGYGEIIYDDYINCDNSLPQPNVGGDMIFNHFSRQDEDDYPDVEEVIDDEMGDEWE